MIITILTASLVLVTTGLVYSLKKNIELMDRLEAVESAVDDSLEVLDAQYQKIDLKSRIEVFSDEPVVRDLVQDIFLAKKSVLIVARTLNSSLTDEENEDIEDATEKS